MKARYQHDSNINGDEPTDEQLAEQCPVDHQNLNYGADCENYWACCKEGYMCSGIGNNWQCTYDYPECSFVPVNWSSADESYNYEEFISTLSFFENYYLTYQTLSEDSYAYRIGHIEGALSDFPCKCPDGTDTRFVYAKNGMPLNPFSGGRYTGQDFVYMYCIENS